MRFSIIIVCLNAGIDLLKTVESTLNQTFSDYEILVKDGFSKDGSVDQLPKNSKIKIIRKKDSGIYDAMNQAIAECSGEYVIFMNAGDCFFNEKVLELANQEMLKKNGYIYYGKSYNAQAKMFDKCPPMIDKYFCFRSMICHQATIYKASLIKKRMYDVTYKISADREWLMYAVIKENVHPVYIPVNVALFQGGGLSCSRKGIERLKEENRKLLKQYFTLEERVKYNIRYMMTLPHIRKLITKNAVLARVYNKLVGIIYGT